MIGALTAPATFEEFYRAERRALYHALALTLGDADLATEAVDEGMVRAYQRWGRVRSYDNPAGWVYRVALNWAISRLRRSRRALPVDAVPEVAAPEGSPPDDALARAVAALPHKQRAVVVLRFHLDWSVDEVAAALHVPPGTVKSRLHRGLATLREELEGTR